MAGDELAPRRGKCGGKKRQGEGYCTRPAGWGTPHPGHGRCKFHGGSTPSGVAAGLNTQAAFELARLDVPPVTNPFTELARLAGQTVAWKDAMAAKVNELTSIRYENQVGGEQLRAEIALWERALDRCVTTLTAMSRLNIDDRLARIHADTVTMIDRAFAVALAASGADLDGQARARQVMKRELKVIPGEVVAG